MAYKGLDKDFQCRGFQYEVGKTYTHDGPVEACKSGFHACENPFDVWGYYPVIDADGSFSRYAAVEQSGETHKEGDKTASDKISITAELKFPDFIAAAVKDVIAGFETVLRDEARIGSSGDAAQIGSSGDEAQIGSSGNGARIGSSGDEARIGSSGYAARIGSSGYAAQIGSSGDEARIGSSGYAARIGSSGYAAQIGSSGDEAQIGSSGNAAQIKCEGANAVAASAGVGAKINGKTGTWVSLACYRDGKCIGFATGCIGHDGLKPDTWYRAEDCKFVECVE